MRREKKEKMKKRVKTGDSWSARRATRRSSPLTSVKKLEIDRREKRFDSSKAKKDVRTRTP